MLNIKHLAERKKAAFETNDNSVLWYDDKLLWKKNRAVDFTQWARNVQIFSKMKIYQNLPDLIFYILIN